MSRFSERFGTYLLGCAAAAALLVPLAGAQAHIAQPAPPFQSGSDSVMSDVTATGVFEVAQQTSADPVLSQRHANKRRHMRTWRRHHGEAGSLTAGDGPALADASSLPSSLRS